MLGVGHPQDRADEVKTLRHRIDRSSKERLVDPIGEVTSEAEWKKGQGPIDEQALSDPMQAWKRALKSPHRSGRQRQHRFDVQHSILAGKLDRELLGPRPDPPPFNAGEINDVAIAQRACVGCRSERLGHP
jgi:hypothetical protein